MLLDFAQNSMINIKSTKRNDTSQQHFPGSGFKFPMLFNSNAQSIKYKKQEKYAMNWPERFY